MLKTFILGLTFLSISGNCTIWATGNPPACLLVGDHVGCYKIWEYQVFQSLDVADHFDQGCLCRYHGFLDECTNDYTEYW